MFRYSIYQYVTESINRYLKKFSFFNYSGVDTIIISMDFLGWFDSRHSLPLCDVKALLKVEQLLLLLRLSCVRRLPSNNFIIFENVT